MLPDPGKIKNDQNRNYQEPKSSGIFGFVAKNLSMNNTSLAKYITQGNPEQVPVKNKHSKASFKPEIQKLFCLIPPNTE